MADLHELLSRLWEDYTALNPHALSVHKLLESRGESVVNDHIALRTFDDPRVGVEVLARAFLRFGYEPRGEYEFVKKKLRAMHYEHPDPAQPLVFISELKLAEMPEFVRDAVQRMIDQMPPGATDRWDFPVMGRPWSLDFATCQHLADASEYAGWLSAMGFRANHFTVLVNALKTFDSLEQLNDFLEQNGFQLNAGGGKIKGSPRAHLEQSSTLAEKVEIEFTDGGHVIPGCYYEFARRYPLPDGELFRGFVTQSADRIFESTDRRGD